MNPSHDMALRRLESARRAAASQIRMIERQVASAAWGQVTTIRARSRDYGRSRTSWSHADEQFYQWCLSALTFAHHGEIDALVRKLALQDAAIEMFRYRHCVAEPLAA